MKRIMFLLPALLLSLLLIGCERVSETPDSYLPSIMIDGVLYHLSDKGETSGDVDPSAIQGEITSTVPLTQLPKEHGQANFGSAGDPYAFTSDGLVVLFNNEIYGLTKGQYSPTSKLGKITKTSPYGTVERPFNPGELVIGAHGTFFARSIDAEVNLTTECMVAASKHDGLSVIEVLVNCMIFNNGTHKAFAGDKEVRAEHTITLRQGEKMLFGKNMDKGLMLDNMKLKVVTVGENGVTLDDILVHDAHEKDTMVHVMLASMKYPDFPVALGIIRDVAEPTYEREVARQIAEVQATAKIKNVDDLLNSGETWEVE